MWQFLLRPSTSSPFVPTEVSLLATLHARVASNFSSGTARFTVALDQELVDDGWGWSGSGAITCPAGTAFVTASANIQSLGGAFQTIETALLRNATEFARQFQDDQFRNTSSISGGTIAVAGDEIKFDAHLSQGSRTIFAERTTLSVRAYG